MNEKAEYDAIGFELVERFPELSLRYKAVLQQWQGEEPGPQIIFDDVLVPHIRSVLAGRGNDEDARALFSFLEELLARDSQFITDLVGASVCENLNAEKALLTRARALMGPRTLALSMSIEEAWG